MKEKLEVTYIKASEAFKQNLGITSPDKAGSFMMCLAKSLHFFRDSSGRPENKSKKGHNLHY